MLDAHRIRKPRLVASLLGCLVLTLSACAPAAAPTPTAAKPAAGATPTAAPAAKPAASPGATASPAASPVAQTGASSPPVALSGTAKIGAVFSQTAAGAQYGATQKNGVQLAVDEINASRALGDARIEVVFEDDASDKAPGINAFQKLINQDRVLAIIGPTLSNTAQATNPVAQSSGVPVLGVSNTAGGITEIGNFIFRDSLTEAQVIPQTVAAVKQKAGVQKAALLYGNDDAFTQAGYEVMKRSLQESGIQITSEQTFTKGDKEFSAQLTVIRGTNPDALFVSALVDEAVGIVTQARRLGMDKLPIVGGNGFNSPALMKGADNAAEGVIVGAAWNSASSNPKSQDFIRNYKARFNADPDQFAAQAYAGVYIMAEGMKHANSVTDRQALREGLGKVSNLDTVLGSFSFTAGRDAQHPAVVQIVRNGAFAVY
ncbi:MAG: ABC transporter substrate-binding protein [Chloroflexota bacterium]